jgi:hypothetical protein
VTIANRPSLGRDGAGYGFDLGQAKRNIFLHVGLDRVSVICPTGVKLPVLMLPILNSP